MNDLKIIEENYSKMNDAQLLKVWNEKHKYRKEVVEVLILELKKRNLEFEETNILSDSQIPNQVHENIKTVNNEKAIIREDIKYYIERNQPKELILGKISEKYNIGKDQIEELFREKRMKGNTFIILGILISFPAILRLIILGNSGYNPNFIWDLLYFLITAISSVIFLYSGYILKKNYK